MTDDDSARLGYLLTAEQTEKVMVLSKYMKTHPYALIPRSIERMWDAYLAATRGEEDPR